MSVEMFVRIGLSLILISLALYDLKWKRVPNVVVLPLLLATIPLAISRILVGAVSWGQIGLIGLAWVVCFVMQVTRMLGGGDAKLAMALVGIFPAPELVNLLLVVFLLGHLLALLSRDRWSRIQRLKGILLSVFIFQQLPTRDEIRAVALANPTPVTYLISLAGLIYMWTGPMVRL